MSQLIRQSLPIYCITSPILSFLLSELTRQQHWAMIEARIKQQQNNTKVRTVSHHKQSSANMRSR